MTSLQDYSDDNDDTDLLAFMLTGTDAPDGYRAFDTVSIDDTIIDTNTKAHDTIWRMYRYAMLNCRDSEKYIKRWQQRFSDIISNVSERYSTLFRAYETYRADGSLISLDAETSVTVNGGTTDNGNNTTATTTEALPQYANADTGEWLTGRVKSTGTNSDTVQNYSEAVSKGVAGYLPAELLSRLRRNNWNPYEDLAGEVQDMFVPFYIDECGCDYGGCN